MTEHSSALLSVGDYIRYAASRFQAARLHFGHGTDNAIDEAAALVLGSLHLPPDLHSVYFQCRLTAEEQALLDARIEERVQTRLPVAYILGEAWFCGLSFEVDESVLIPRSPIAELIESGFAPWVDPNAVRRIADVGTGSGCIAIAAALAFPGVRVDALDIAPGALAWAAHNAKRHDVSGQVAVQRSDLLAAVPAEPLLDVIVSNPPYVDARSMIDLPAEYQHEPRQALAAGADGMDIVRRLLPEAAERLTDQGVFFCEIGHGARAFTQAFPDLPVTWVEFERGGQGVFAVDAATLKAAFAQ